jgi:energy-coupling factor transport system ATP-binding protein
MKLVDIRKLTFEYFRRDDEGNVEEVVEAIQNVSLDVEQGEFIAILGRNGSGKSTLAKHINALLLPGEGEVIVDGMDTTDEELRLKIRQSAGMVFQNPDNQIVANLVEEDVAFGPENLGVPTSDIWNRVNKALEVTEMEEYRNQSPNHLSGGQKQRVAIAGVLAMEPKCIIFDEATAMLNPAGRKQMMEVAVKLQKEKNITIILITHHMEEALQADRVFVMNEGRVEAQGTPKEVFTQKELLKRCGLCLPVYYEYMNFLLAQGLITSDDCKNVDSAEKLEQIVMRRYGVSEMEESEQSLELTNSLELQEGMQGIILNQVSYTYNKGYAD